jgi:hypothetical protein
MSCSRPIFVYATGGRKISKTVGSGRIIEVEAVQRHRKLGSNEMSTKGQVVSTLTVNQDCHPLRV